MYLFTQDVKSAQVENAEYAAIAKIYKKPDHLLNDYEKEINKAAIELVQDDYSLLLNRGELFNKAKEIVRNGNYQFKKGYSRSKHATDQTTKGASSVPRRQNTCSDDRKARIVQLTEQIKEVKHQIAVKEKRKVKAESVHDYLLCDRMSTEKRKLLSEQATLENELKLIQRKEQKSHWYHQKPKTGKTTSKSNQTSSKNNKNQSKQNLHAFFTPSGQVPKSVFESPVVIEEHNVVTSPLISQSVVSIVDPVLVQSASNVESSSVSQSVVSIVDPVLVQSASNVESSSVSQSVVSIVDPVLVQSASNVESSSVSQSVVSIVDPVLVQSASNVESSSVSQSIVSIVDPVLVQSACNVESSSVSQSVVSIVDPVLVQSASNAESSSVSQSVVSIVSHRMEEEDF